MNEDKGAFILFLVMMIVCIHLVCIIVVFGFIMSQPTGPTYTTSYSLVNASQAKELIESNNITIVDCTGGCKPCNYKYRILDALWEDNPENLYNETSDIIAYSSKGDHITEEFCVGLLNHTYGEIYFLAGGYDAWMEIE